MKELSELVQAVLPDAVELRRDLHAHPELAFQEHRTSQRVIDELQKIDGLWIRQGIAGTGVVAVLNRKKTGRCVGLRADMDALPILEETGVPYASQYAGRTHACGHDGHVSCLVGTARVLAGIRDTLPGQVKFIFQPAEEDGAGGQKLCEAGVLENPHVDALFALHGWPEEEVGSIAVGRGPVHAASNPFDIVVHGKGAHGAYPHQGVDPIVAAAAIVTALQTVVSRNVNPLDTAVVTIGQIQAGTAINIVPESCKLTGTIRTLSSEIRQTVVRRVREIAEHVAVGHGASAEVSIVEGYPVTINDDVCVALIVQVAREVLGGDCVRTDLRPSMGAEDFAYYAQRVPAAIFRLGTRPRGATTSPKLHTPRMDFNDDALPVGITLLTRIVQAYLTRLAPALQ